MQKAPCPAKWIFHHARTAKEMPWNQNSHGKAWCLRTEISSFEPYFGWLGFPELDYWHTMQRRAYGMKKILSMITLLALATSITTDVTAKTEKKNQPKARFVKENLASIGDKHSPEKPLNKTKFGS